MSRLTGGRKKASEQERKKSGLTSNTPLSPLPSFFPFPFPHLTPNSQSFGNLELSARTETAT